MIVTLQGLPTEIPFSKGIRNLTKMDLVKFVPFSTEKQRNKTENGCLGGLVG